MNRSGLDSYPAGKVTKLPNVCIWSLNHVSFVGLIISAGDVEPKLGLLTIPFRCELLEGPNLGFLIKKYVEVRKKEFVERY